MKNLKKVLAMVLAFACTFTMFASAKVYEDVQPGSEFSEAITMLSDLGIIQGKSDSKYHPEDTITRAEACALIARLMTGDPNAAGFGGAHHFKDVVKGSWQDSAIGYCVVNGIAIGVDAAGTRFEPNRPIKDKEFVTMLVRALGYETPDMKKDFPFSYMSSARAIGLLEDVNMIPDTDALRGEDAQVIFNAMFVDYARGAKMVNTTHGTSVEKYPTLAESVWKLDRAAVGTWNKKDNEDVTLSNCKAHTWVIIGEAQDEENALLAYPIDDDTTELYKAEEKKYEYKPFKFKYEGDADALRGYQVELWGAGKHGEPTWEKEGDKFVYSQDWTIKAIKTVKGQTKYDYNASMSDKKDDNGSIVLAEDKTVDLGSVADNAKNVTHADEVAEVVTFLGNELNTIKVKEDKDVEKALNVRNGMQYQLMDWDSDGNIDWIVVDEARYYKVESATSKRVTVTSMDGNNLKSDKDSKTETWKIDESEKIGKNEANKDVKIKYEVPEGLKEGDVVEVTYKVTYEDKAQLITATVKTVDADNQKLEKVGTKDGLTLTFGDEEVKVAQNAKTGDVIVPANPETYKGFNGEELGTEFALYKNRNGFLVYSDYATESSNYMMVLNTFGGKDTTGNRDLAVIDFVDANNQMHKDVKVSSGVRVLDKNGDTLVGRFNSQKAYDNREFDESQVVGNVFKYWTDADGVITKMQAVFDAAGAEMADEYEYDADADRLIDTTGASKKYVASLEDANIIFAVKENYIRSNGTADDRVIGENLEVKSDDVLATKQKDIPDINNGADKTHPKQMLGNRLKDNVNAWMGNNTNKQKVVVQLNNNSEASAAILGVENFNKFNAGQTKLALVTNVSEDSKGVIEAEVAFDGKVETVASAEKQDFEDIVKVYNGSEDKDITGADATITAPDNGIFNGGKLSDLVNDGGQYAEITVDADGKLTKLVFMDDDTTDGNDNKLRGHYYTVSRNLVREVKDKNLRYHLNNNKDYSGDKAAQLYAGSDDKLQTVKRLPSESAGYAEDAKFYQIDGTPTRHDNKYEGTRLTVNDGFNRLRQSDIKVIEKSDIGASEPNFDSKKNVYEVSDLAFNSDGDLVAVYSFKNDLDEDADYKYVKPADKFDVTGVQFAKTNGTATGNEVNTLTGKNDQFVVYVEGAVNKTKAGGVGVTGLTKENFKVTFGSTGVQPVVENATAIANNDGFYVLDLNMNVDTGRAVTVEVIGGGNIVNVASNAKVEDTTPVLGGGDAGTTTPGTGSEESANATNIVVKNIATADLTLQVLDKQGSAMDKLPASDFKVSVNGRELTQGTDFDVTLPTIGSTEYKLTLKTGGIIKTADWTDAAIKNVTITVGKGCSETYTQQVTADAIAVTSTAVDYALNSATDKFEVSAVTLVNVKETDVKAAEVKVGADKADNHATDITVNGGKLYIAANWLNTLKENDTVKFKLTDGSTVSSEVTVTVKAAPTLASDVKATQTKGEKANAGKQAKYTATVTASTTAADKVKVALKKDGTTIVETDEVTITQSNDNQSAQALATALQNKLKAAGNEDYTVENTNSTNKIVATAKTPATEKLTIELTANGGGTTTLAKDGTLDACVDGVEPTAGKAGTLTFTVPAGATEEAEWTLTINKASPDAKVVVSLRANDTAEAIAEMVAKKITATASLNLTATNNGAEVTITEATGHEGDTFKDTTADDVKFAKN